ncbi:bile acid transporter [Kluyvera cryocrescens]|uniref:Bile acid transporter n=1 Tax=Kluyvera cryocrescens TaxID=580 RepID=A0A485BBP7_KLUCR|nr:bile acid transporter [Kluyvera cryocrescens]
MLAVLTRLFPLWALLLSVIAYFTPSTFTPIGPLVPSLLMLIMFGMGVHLKVDDFKRVLSRPAPVAAGIFLHYLVMPLAALAAGPGIPYAAGAFRRNGAGRQRRQRYGI